MSKPLDHFLRGIPLLLACVLATSGALAAAHSKPKLVMLIAEKAYETDKTLPIFAEKFLAKDFRVVAVTGSMEKGQNSFDRIEEVADADILLVSVVRRNAPAEQLAVIRKHIAAGKPVVGIRTAGHAFHQREPKPLPSGHSEWRDWDATVIGGNYTGHHAMTTVATITAADPKHPILRGVKVPFEFKSGLYKVSPLRPGAHAILHGAVPGQPVEPVAWTFTHQGGGKTFYTSLGATTDFANPNFTTLLRNGILWAAGKQ